jgi:hypothetical protein
MLKKLTGIITTLALLSSQVYAKPMHVEMDLKLSQIVNKINNGMDKDQIIDETKSFVDTAKAEDVSLEEILMVLSDLFDLDLTEEEIAETIEEVQRDYGSLDKEKQIEQLAGTLADKTEDQRLIFFSIILMLMIVFYFP